MPQVYNKTRFVVEVIPMIDRAGHNIAVVIVKGTYEFREDRGLQVAPVQEPIIFADVMLGDSGKGDLRLPSDLIDYKPATDVLIVQPSGGLSHSSLFGRRITVEVGPVHISERVGGKWEYGPLRRDKNPRKGHAGTYNKEWVEHRMPLLPEDFDPRFNQAAPPRQQVSNYLKGDERIKLVNLYGEGSAIESALPSQTVVVSGNVLSHYFTEVAVLDTVLIWSDKPQISLLWRQVIRSRQKIEEVRNVYVYLVRLRTARELYGKP
jgi:hypothetical protein